MAYSIGINKGIINKGDGGVVETRGLVIGVSTYQ
jgi:hypothetical protein